MADKSSTVVEMNKNDIGLGTMPVLIEGDRVMLLDQRKLPEETVFFDATDLDDMCFAISDMVIRGAASIGVAGALGLACAARMIATTACEAKEFTAKLDAARIRLNATRPTAVNLTWGTSLIFEEAEKLLNQERGKDLRQVSDEDQARESLQRIGARLFAVAVNLIEEHAQDNRRLSEYGAQRVPVNGQILTHCNAGSLALCGWGSALGVIRSAQLMGKNISVFVDETRPRNQGSKLTMWELEQDGIPTTLICDNMAATLMAQNKVSMIVVGADRIARNGDTANKIGTYGLAVLAHFHGVKFYVAAPLSTFDPDIESGHEIHIETRDAREVTEICGRSTTIPSAKAYNPAFDVTPNRLISAFFTEAGILEPPYLESIDTARKSKTRQ